jgi:hypothetical protein
MFPKQIRTYLETVERKGIVCAGCYFSSDPLGGPYNRPYGANKWFLPLRGTKQAKINQDLDPKRLAGGRWSTIVIFPMVIT